MGRQSRRFVTQYKMIVEAMGVDEVTHRYDVKEKRRRARIKDFWSPHQKRERDNEKK